MAVVEDAVLVAGGIGSRMLPASAVIAKELLPLVDVPALSHLAREAVEAGAKASRNHFSKQRFYNHT